MNNANVLKLKCNNINVCVYKYRFEIMCVAFYYLAILKKNLLATLSILFCLRECEYFY